MKNLQELLGNLSLDEEQKRQKYYIVAKQLQNGEIFNNGEWFLSISNDDWKNAYTFSFARNIRNQRAGIIDRYCGNDPMRGEILGVLAEIVIEKKYNYPFSDNIEPRSGSKDMTLRDKDIDIKICMPHNNDGDMIVVSESKNINSVHCYFFCRLVNYNGNKMINLYGWCNSNEIILQENKMPGRRGYWMLKEKLHKFRN